MGRRFWEFKAAEDKPGIGELMLYGEISDISWFGDEITPADFKADLDALGDISELRVMINSGGGDVFAGQAIHSMLTRHPAHVTVFVDGIAASIASVVAMAGDTVIMPRNAMMMIHNPYTIGIGDAREFRKLADTLDSIRESIIVAYEAKTEMGRAELLPLLDAETWMTAEQAVKLGFADQIEEKKAIAASMVRPGVAVVNGQEFDLSHFKNAPEFSEAPREVEPKEKPTKRDLEHALRDAGLSQNEAKAVVSRGYEEPATRDVPVDDSERARTATERLRAESDRIAARIKREFVGVK